jgi:hypothetical protein
MDLSLAVNLYEFGTQHANAQNTLQSAAQRSRPVDNLLNFQLEF